MSVNFGRSSQASRTATLSVGDAAPDFELLDRSGTSWKLSDRRGSANVVIAFYPFAFSPT
jgi:peroxiredoxin